MKLNELPRLEKSLRYEERRWEYQHQRALTEKLTEDYLKATTPHKMPIDLYALWLWAWERDGGKVAHERRGLLQTENLPYLVPTRSTRLQIPTAYGANALTLFVCTDLVRLNPARSSSDRRPGWQWGHTHVLTLNCRRNHVEARTNQDYAVESYPEVRSFIKMHDMAKFERSYIGICRAARKAKIPNLRGA